MNNTTDDQNWEQIKENFIGLSTTVGNGNED